MAGYNYLAANSASSLETQTYGNTTKKPSMPSVVVGAIVLCALGMAVFGLFLIIVMSSMDPHAPPRPYGSPESAFKGYAACFLFLLLLLVGLATHNRLAWYVQVIISALGLLGFPIFTVIYGLILRSWFKPEVKAWFGMAAPANL